LACDQCEDVEEVEEAKIGNWLKNLKLFNVVYGIKMGGTQFAEEKKLEDCVKSSTHKKGLMQNTFLT